MNDNIPPISGNPTGDQRAAREATLKELVEMLPIRKGPGTGSPRHLAWRQYQEAIDALELMVKGMAHICNVPDDMLRRLDFSLADKAIDLAAVVLKRERGDRVDGFYRCTNCGNVEQEEREVICWRCGDGEMVWVK